MSPISDQELQRHLARRTTMTMPPADREDVLAAVAGARARPRFSFRMRPSLLLAPIAALVLVVLVAVPLLWTLAPGPGPSPSPSSGAVTIYTAQQLSDMIGDPAWVGHYVIGQAQLAYIRGATQCVAPDPCANAYLVGVSGKNVVSVGWRDAPEGQGTHLADGEWVQPLTPPQAVTVSTFEVASDTVEFLGPAKLAPGDAPMTTAGAGSPSQADPVDDVYVVSGWLTEPLPPGCPTSPPGNGDGSWACDGSWLTPTDQRVTAFSSPTDGLHTQNGAYADFAPDPQYADNGPTPRFGTYLVRPAGTAETLEGQSPVWRMVGRLDQALEPAPSESIGPSPSPPPSLSPLDVLTQDQLIALAQDPLAAGRVVIADAQFAPVPSASEADCNVPDPCYAGQIGVNPGVVVFSGWRDSAKDGTGTFYAPEGRWLDRLVPSSLQEHVMAFRIGHESVEYLGTVQESGNSLIWSPDDVPAAGSAAPDSIYAVAGWLVRTLPVPCPMPGGLPANTDFGYFCGGSFITATADAIAKTKNDLDPGGLHVQAGAYNAFALNAASIPADTTLASTSDRAVYLVRPVGERVWEANAWRLVDRIDPPLAAPEPSPSVSPSTTPTLPAAENVHIYTAQQMVDMVGVPGLIGRYVVARAQMEHYVHYGYPPCTVPSPCFGAWGLVGVSGYSGISVAWRDANPGEGTSYQGPNGTEWLDLLTPPSAEGVYAFKILSREVEYLGPAQLSADGSAWTVPDLMRLAPNGPTDDVYAVSGSLIRPNSPECPAPNDSDSNPDLSWFCGGSWITSSHDWPVDPLHVNGIHVQWTAYRDFGPTPFYDTNGGLPTDGTYLVRTVGCPTDVTGDCPVYRMIGRLNPVMASQ